MSDDTRTGASARPSRRWYAPGLAFACLPGCGACCTRHGDYDYVYLDPDDVTALATHLGLTRDEFRSRHVATEDGYELLRMDGPDCPFLSGSRCTVYAARPTQCRTFPCWTENLRTRAAWERLRSFCPGIGAGEVLSAEEIGRALEREERSSRD